MGSAGAKTMAIVLGDADVYAHAGGQYQWDSAAPVAVARAAGLHTSRLDGSPAASTTRPTRTSRTSWSAAPSSPKRSLAAALIAAPRRPAGGHTERAGSGHGVRTVADPGSNGALRATRDWRSSHRSCSGTARHRR